MGSVVVLRTAFRGRAGACRPRIRAKLHGWAALANAGELTEEDWAAINRARIKCLRCGACPDLAVRLMMPPARMAMQPFPAQEPPRERPALRMW